MPRVRALTAATCRPLSAVFYTETDWLRLAQKMRANPSACADYYVSIPPLAADKTKLRNGEAAKIRALGPQMHAVAEANVTGWTNWVNAGNGTWYDAGVEMRNRMIAAGFDVTAGDIWGLNEISSAVRTGTGNARANMRDFIRGLDDRRRQRSVGQRRRLDDRDRSADRQSHGVPAGILKAGSRIRASGVT